MNIDQALNYTGSETVTVSGFLLGCEGQSIKLCSELLESFPPQCGGKSLMVHCFNFEGIPGLKSAEGYFWSDAPVELKGKLNNCVLFVNS